MSIIFLNTNNSCKVKFLNASYKTWEKKSNLCKTSPAKTIKYCLYVSKVFQKGALRNLKLILLFTNRNQIKNKLFLGTKIII